MRGGARGPETESIVVLRGEDHCSSAGGSSRTRPLARVETGRRKDGWALAPVAPLAVRERVDAEMEEQCQLVALPLELCTRWPRGIHRLAETQGQASRCERCGRHFEER